MSLRLPNSFILVLPLALSLIGLTFSVLADPYIRRVHRRVMLIIIAVIFTLILQNVANYQIDALGTAPRARILISICGYVIRPVIIVLFFYLVGKRRSWLPAWILIGVNAAIYLTALWTDLCFTIDENNRFQRGPLSFTCHIVSIVLLIYLVYLTIREHKGARKRELFIPIFNAALIVASVALESGVDNRNHPVSYLTIAVVSSSVFYYIWLHLQFVREHENDLRAQQRIQIMMTQIQPHFLYNTIATFKALCRKDPEKAAEVADKFAIYLRQNMDSLDVTGCIPFAQELSHTKIYADIEMVRFDHIQVDYDIADEGFDVPPLSVQPMVENAIRHGVRIREEGRVRVATRRCADAHEIVIADNGTGFDVRTLEQPSAEGQHIGIRNVRERVEKMCGGTLSIDSRAGEGTTVTIRIPARERETA